MEDALNQFVIDNFGLSVFVMVALIIGIIALSIWCHSIYVRAKRIDTLPCDTHKEKMHEHENAVGRIETALEYIQKNIESLSQSIQSNNKGIVTDPFTQTHSPLSLTEKGKEIAENLGLRKMIDKKWAEINMLIKDNANSLNPYDIQQFCIEQAIVYPEKFLCQEDLEKMKNEAYRTGILLTSYMRVIAVLSRDRYFEENGIDVSEVDASDPRLATNKD